MTCEKHGEITESQEGRVTSHDIINAVNIKLYIYMLTMRDLSVELMVKRGGSCLGVNWYGSALDTSKYLLAFCVVLSGPGDPQFGEVRATFPLSLSG